MESWACSSAGAGGKPAADAPLPDAPMTCSDGGVVRSDSKSPSTSTGLFIIAARWSPDLSLCAACMDRTYQATGAVSLGSASAWSTPAESPELRLAASASPAVSSSSSSSSSRGMTEVNSSR